MPNKQDARYVRFGDKVGVVVIDLTTSHPDAIVRVRMKTGIETKHGEIPVYRNVSKDDAEFITYREYQRGE